MSDQSIQSIDNKEKIVIIVRGGVVQNVYSNIKDIDIDILDFDDLIDEPKSKYEVLYQQKTENLLIAY
ncbi:MAG: hypothetical protein IPJ03_06980 [Ignavibacteriales bacterium]|nr:hypothetical protein [Ignavibacteriales bacterium]